MSSTRPAAMRPVEPIPTKPYRAWFLIAWLSLVVALVLLCVAAARAGGICAAVPCEPLTGSVGFVAVGDQIGVLVGQRTAPDVATIEVLGGADPWADDAPVLWKVERTGATALDGPVLVGDIPAGFRQTVPAHGELAGPSSVLDGEISAVRVSSACFFGSVEWPTTAPVPGRVESWGDVTDRATFDRDDEGFSPCDDAASESGAGRFAAAGAVALLASFGLFVAVSDGRRRWRRQFPHPYAARR